MSCFAGRGLWGGAQSARSWVMGTLGILGSKFLKILKLMGTLVGVDWGWSGWGWKVVGAHLLGAGKGDCQHELSTKQTLRRREKKDLMPPLTWELFTQLYRTAAQAHLRGGENKVPTARKQAEEC